MSRRWTKETEGILEDLHAPFHAIPVASVNGASRPGPAGFGAPHRVALARPAHPPAFPPAADGLAWREIAREAQLPDAPLRRSSPAENRRFGLPCVSLLGRQSDRPNCRCGGHLQASADPPSHAVQLFQAPRAPCSSLAELLQARAFLAPLRVLECAAAAAGELIAACATPRLPGQQVSVRSLDRWTSLRPPVS